MQKPFIIGLSLLASVASITTARAGETLDRVKENKELIAVMDQSYPPYSFLNVDRHRGRQLAAPLPHHLACGSAPGGSRS